MLVLLKKKNPFPKMLAAGIESTVSDIRRLSTSTLTELYERLAPSSELRAFRVAYTNGESDHHRLKLGLAPMYASHCLSLFRRVRHPVSLGRGALHVAL